MILQQSTWSEVEGYLTRSNGLIVPIGSTEQHGPNGPVGTDVICPEIVAIGVEAAVDVYGCDQFILTPWIRADLLSDRPWRQYRDHYSRVF